MYMAPWGAKLARTGRGRGLQGHPATSTGPGDVPAKPCHGMGDGRQCIQRQAISVHGGRDQFFLKWVSFGHQLVFSLVFSLAAISNFA